MLYRCIICQSTAGEPAPRGEQTWYWVDNSVLDLRVGPFCSKGCSDKAKEKSVEDLLVLIFGSAERAYYLRYLYRQGKIKDASAEQDQGIATEWAESAMVVPCPESEDMSISPKHPPVAHATLVLKTKQPAAAEVAADGP